jgi:hypothetical protein
MVTMMTLSAPAVLLNQRRLTAFERGLSVSEREALIENAIGSMRSDLRSKGLQEVISGKSDLVIRPLLSVLKPIRVSDILGTKFDVSYELMRHAVQFGYGRRLGGKQSRIFTSASAGAEKYLSADAGYGNGFYWGRKDRFVTALHVLDSALGKAQNSNPLDIAILPMTTELQATDEQIVRGNSALMDVDVDLSYVAACGIDPDETSIKTGVEGCKIYPGLAVRLTSGWVDKAFGKADLYFRERLYRSFMLLLPHGEAKGAANSAPASGMSGSPVFMLRNGEKIGVGLLHSVFEVPSSFTGSTLDLGFFYGPEAIRQAIVQNSRLGD